ncbi:MAG: cupin domain-containing protein [Kiritimatiellae bacterium]|nr:cupin domain-containing protein [Kiritimatiellia bacterium]MDD5519386.1 cupin domain-containing protein [Kiritimatiellia bacterium]
MTDNKNVEHAETDIRGKLIKLAEGIEYARGSVVSKTLHDKKTGTLTLFSFDTGQGLSEHTSPYDATVEVIEGEADLNIGGKLVKVKAGEMVIMPANVPHSVKAEKRFKMLLIMIR